MADKFTERENYILGNSINIEWFLEAINKNNPLHPEEGAAHTESYELNGQNILVPRVRIKNGKAILNKENALEEALEKGDYIIVPEGEDPDQYSKDLSALIGKFRGFNEGGKVGNMSMKQQMSLFEYGGIADDGMTKDPVSGNNIPPGSLAKEVRDDIPAMLSEGEYVIPADVLRYYGVNFFENLRGQAKQGLQNMEQNGRIGGTPMTQQDVSRNMQQPMMANQGVMVQGFDDGNLAQKYRSNWSPATARWNTPMFTGTSSQATNIAQAAEAAETGETGETGAAAESITYMRTHYNQSGESVQIRYVGTTPENAVPAPGQEDLLAAYPLTEAEWLAYQQQMNSDDGGGGEEDPVSSGSDVGFLEGIDYTDEAKVQAWADEKLGLSTGQKLGSEVGGLLFGGAAAISQARDIAEVRAMAEIQRAAGNTEFADKLDAEAEKAIKSSPAIISAFDKLGFMTGDKLAKQGMEVVGTTIAMQNAMRGAGTDSATMTSPGLSGDTAESKAEIAKEQTVMSQQVVPTQNTGGEDNDGPSHQEILDMHSRIRAEADAFASKSEEEKQEQYASVGGGFQDIMNKKAEGGLMTAPKPKKKRGRPKKSGLAGKK